MSNYHLKPLTTLSSLAAQEKKMKRRKLLEEVRERQRQLYKRFREKMQLQAASDLL